MDGYREIKVNPGFRKKGFSTIEIRDIAVSVIVLAIAFTVIYSRRVMLFGTGITNVLGWFSISIALVVASFLLHEFGHKFMAQRFGAWAEYRMFPMGLVFALLMSAVGFLFAAPGAVYIQGRIDRRQNGIISVAGPAVNLILAVVFFCITKLFVYGSVATITYLFAYLNAFLALFNLLPIPPLDGSKVMAWDLRVYIPMLVCAGAMLLLLFK